MPTMTIPSANLRRLKKLAAEGAAKSSSVEGGGRDPRADLCGRSNPPPPMPRRRENRAALLAQAAACDSDETGAAGAGEDGKDTAAAAAGFAVGARVLVRTPVAASAGTAAQPMAFLRAVVVSAADEDGYLEVVYEGASSQLPGGGENPLATVRVQRDQIVADAPPRVVTATSYASGGAGSEASSPALPVLRG